ncbi:proline/betaine ABC transporter permease ProW [Brenneria goodwinii]|uniref:L-proline glycine betaine ABC transport system permease protein ProW (TC 3.A.1.12.1) n=1 Tax=Brenneria goodwinii TaxID=1109412 RepID=A0A0G4JWD4_9GAMM|nr:glycine betaine/L-proline ABC transporter permease ProW [Brenneria goodwinii]ATA22780.1 glycine/betaine ABC transporter permease [Brenneria goodwinii]MCG8158562.1 glycine betaine/L-proline ABC transporter permease ProW [Brenneria goodwinii]MCG8163009.1 glycine betaine/L-proline ABC transporter permease ProW [Brenneria goodwinii]MCG8167848.1 glycine betaine/L-proline ABC transporter permease ProW [Brenneria goodwinii]MCG8172432.1 glycine betaine/L-proline ABC transporter permease ProW [Brenn
MSKSTTNPWESSTAPEQNADQHSAAAQSDPWAASTQNSPQAESSAAPDAGSQSDPWSTAAPAQDAPANGADAWSTTPPDGGSADAAQGANDWLNSAPTDTPEHFSLLDPFKDTLIPLDHWVTHGIDWMVLHFRPLFQGIRVPVDFILSTFQQLLLGMPAPIAILIFSLIAWQVSSFGMGVAALISLVIIGAIGAWSQAMVTLALVLTALFFCLLIGLPIGIWLARSERAAKIIRPLLDAMQTTPAFVYLVPIVMLFGIGNVPGVVVTIIFALPPIIRLTILGIRQVPADLIEAAESFGASPRQMLFKVQLPLAMPTIMAGVNQTLMLALSMVVIASMIAVGGLGQMVLRGIGRLDMGLAAVGGVGIVILAIILDRLTQSLGRDRRSKGNKSWYTTGPIGLVTRPFIKQ